MSFAIDAVILFCAIIIIWSGTRKGFVRSVMGLVSGIASLFVAYAYSPVLSEYIKDNYLIERITSGISETLRSLSFDTSTEMYNLDRLAEDLPEPFVGILDRYGVAVDSFAEKLRGLTGCTAGVVDDYAREIADPVSNVISSAISFILLFVAAFLALSIITSILNLIFKLPILKSANTFFGFVLSAAEAVLVVCILASVLSLLVTSLGSIDPELFGEHVINDTVVCKYLIKEDLFTKISELIGR